MKFYAQINGKIKTDTVDIRNKEDEDRELF
jgi:hypothetical protein